MAKISRSFLFLCSYWSLYFFWDSHQLQSSQTQVLFQLRKQLEYPTQLESWTSHGLDLCLLSSPQVNITCQDNLVSQIRIFGDAKQSLSQNFSMESLVVTLSRLKSLRALSLVSLGLWGPLPDKIHRLQFLEYLDLSWNFLYGSIPQALSRISTLRVLKMDGNFLNSSFPGWLDSFPNLTSLSLSQNMFTGHLPPTVLKLSSLTDINLSKNAISGDLPDLGSLIGLQWLDFSNNRLNAILPTMPRGVTAILLSNNSLFGKIPDQYADLDRLQQLDLSSNALTGSIPTRLTCNGELQLVDISNNRLSGPLPACLSSNVKTGVFKFGGNCLSVGQGHQHPAAYCMGSIREKKEAGEKSSINNNSRRSLGLLIGIVCGVGLVFLVMGFGFLILCRRYCPRGTSEQHLLSKSVNESSVTGFTSEILANAGFISDAAKMGPQSSPAHRPFSMDELKAATNNFDKFALMGEGPTGKIYKGRLESGGQVAIRCLAVSRKYTIRNLKLRLDLLAKLRHPYLVCLLGHCIETDGKSENRVYLIYEYIPNGSYRAHLKETNSEKVLKWSDRLAILVGIAKAVHFLHTGIIPGFYNNRLKASNILLNEQQVGKLSDYGLSVVAQEIDKDKEEDGLKSWQMKSLEDDIHSFGLILLESLVGPSFLGKESFLLSEMVSLSNRDEQRRVVDPIVLASSSQESVAIVISLMMNCVSSETSTRPSFEDVLWNLQYAAQVQGTWDERPGKMHLSP